MKYQLYNRPGIPEQHRAPIASAFACAFRNTAKQLLQLTLYITLFASLAVSASAQISNIVWERVISGTVDGRHAVIAHAESVVDTKPAFSDIDGDGDQDLFIGTAKGEILFLENNGSIQAPVWNVATSRYAGIKMGDYAAPALTDIDNDGDQDLFVGGGGGFSGASMSFYLNTGTATKAEWALITTNYAGATGIPRFVDIDNDGDQDLFTMPEVGFGVSFLENTGTASFAEWTAPTNHELGFFFTLNPRIAFQDIDADGDFDALSGGPGGMLYYSENAGNVSNAFWQPAQSNYAGLYFGPRSAAPTFADIDQDGDADLFVGRGAGGIDFFENVGSVSNATWGPQVPHLNSLSFGLNTSAKPSFGDMDGDGDLDMLVVTRQGDVSLLENEGSPLSPHWTRRDASAHQFICRTNCAPTFGDIDGDGDDDLFVGQTAGAVVFFENIASTSTFFQLAPGVSNYAGTTFTSWNAPKMRDMDSDGDLDLLLGVGAGPMQYYENNGSATQAQWAVPVSISNTAFSLNGNRTFGAGDLDGDGDLDLLNGEMTILFPPPGTYDIMVTENFGAPASPLWFFNTPLGFDLGFTAGITQPTLVDIDGDGDLDIYAGGADGDLLLWKNQQPTLTVSPPVQTVVANEQISFDVTGTPFAFWSLVTNRSGASINVSNGVYAAGSNAPALDVIGVQGLSGMVGRAYVNVIRPEDAAEAGKAIIVAGGKSLNDPVWDATDLLADKAYRTLLYRGYAKENIQYLSFEPGQDVDGDGLFDDIDGSATIANVGAAFTSFAQQSDKLFVYLVDHGADAGGQGFMRLSDSEILAAAQLDGWLDGLQAVNPNLCINVMLDFCYAGSFLDELTAPTSAARCVMASTGSDQLTYFIAGGLVSFSDAMLTALQIGHTFANAFDVARGAMSTYQLAEMDDNNDGFYAKGVDGLNSTNQLGVSFISGLDVPVIGSITPNQTIDQGATATIWAEAIDSSYPLERVWSLIVPPSHDPDTSSAIPVINIPEMTLSQSLSDPLRYEATFDGFTEPGTYKVIFLAQDIWGNVSIPKQSYITQGGFEDRAILVATASLNPESASNISFVARAAYETLQSRLFDDDHIYFMNIDTNLDVNGDGTNDVDSFPSSFNLQNAVLGWGAAADRLTVYMLGEGTNNQFRYSFAETAGSEQLDLWLDIFQFSNTEVNVILDFPGSGGFATNLVPPVGQDRIVIASTEPGADGLLEMGGLVSFSQYFLSEIFAGKTLGESFAQAKKTIRRVSGLLRQEALIDDDGDGLFNEKNVDGVFANTRYLGAAFATGEDAPNIGEVMPITGLTNGSSLTLWAANVTDVDGISNVWCVITPPDYGGGSLPSIDLTYNPANSRYEALYSGFTQPGVCVLTFYASDTNGVISAAVQSQVVKPDSYENDDLVAFASPIDIGDPQTHTFHSDVDEDWVMFIASTSHPYEIETTHFSTNIDTIIEIYFQHPGGALEFIDEIDLSGFESGESASILQPSNGLYYVHVRQHVAVGSGPGSYELHIYVPSGGVPNYGIGGLNLLTGGPLPPGSYAVINEATHFFNDELWIQTPLPAGTYTIEVVCAESGFLSLEDKNVPGQSLNISNEDYGNPRIKEVDDTIGNGNIGALFMFIPHVDVSALARDNWTDAPVAGCDVDFGALEGRYSVTNGVYFDGYPFYASYKTPWLTLADGSFPTPVFVPATNVIMRVRGEGYHDLLDGGAVSNLASGDDVDAGELMLIPVDTNGNQIADAWEELHYGGGVSVVATEDDDLDGHNNWEEYVLGTDPMVGADVFKSESPQWEPSGFTLTWPVEPGRNYRVSSSDNLHAEEWTVRGGPWQAIVGQAEMQWTDSSTADIGSRCYRIEVLVSTP